MAKRKFRPQPGQQAPPQSQVKVDLTQAETMNCEHCGNYIFMKATVIKRLSAIVSPTGQEAMIPIEVFSCGNCGKVPTSILRDTGIGLDNEPTKTPLTDLM